MRLAIPRCATKWRIPLLGPCAVVAALAGPTLAADAPVAPAAASPAVDLEKVKATLSIEIRRRIETDRLPSVSIALVRGGEVVWAEAFGVSNVWAKTPATPETLYSTGSTFKTVVATAVMQLVEQGKLSLDTPLTDVLKGLRVRQPEGAGPITIRHVLAHASGLPRGAVTVPIWDRRLPPPIDESARDVEATFAPGTATSYSNLGYGLLGRVIETVTGEPFEEHMRKAVFEPLGMKDTTLAPSAAAVERMALPYSEKESGVEPLRQVRFDVFPAGDVYTTARDMGRFLAAHLGDGALGGVRVLSPESARLMRKRPFPTRDYPRGFGLGFFVDEPPVDGPGTPDAPPGHVIVAHSGSVPGLVAHLRADVTAGVGVYLLSNLDSGGAALESLSRMAVRLLRGETILLFDPATARRDPVPPAWAGLVGSYLSPFEGPIRVQVKEQALRLEVAGRTGWLVPVEGDRFTIRGDDVSDGMPAEFQRDAAGKATAVVVGKGRAGVTAPRLATDAATTMDTTRPPEGVLEGDWEGAAVLSNLRLEFTLRIRREGERLAATVTLPAQGLRDSAVDHLMHHGNKVHFEHGAGAGLALLDGTLDGDSMKGTLRRMSFVFPIEAYRVGSEAAKAARAALAAAAAKAAPVTATDSPFVGEWAGSLRLPGQSLDLRMHVAGDSAATLDIPAQGLAKAPLEAVRREGAKVHFELGSPLGRAVFEGEIGGEKHDRISGTLSQAGGKFAFELSREAPPR